MPLDSSEGMASTVTSRVQGLSWVSSTLKVWRALAGIRIGCGESGETVISLPSRVKMKRLCDRSGKSCQVGEWAIKVPFADDEVFVLIPMPCISPLGPHMPVAHWAAKDIQ